MHYFLDVLLTTYYTPCGISCKNSDLYVDNVGYCSPCVLTHLAYGFFLYVRLLCSDDGTIGDKKTARSEKMICACKSYYRGE